MSHPDGDGEFFCVAGLVSYPCRGKRERCEYSGVVDLFSQSQDHTGCGAGWVHSASNTFSSPDKL